MDSVSLWQNVHLLLSTSPHLNNFSFVIIVWCRILNWMSLSFVEVVLIKAVEKKIC